MIGRKKWKKLKITWEGGKVKDVKGERNEPGVQEKM